MKENIPKIGESMGRRKFLKDLITTVGVTALASKEIGHSEITRESSQEKLLNQLEEALKELIEIESKDHSLKDSVREVVKKYNETIGLIKEVEKIGVYKKRLKSFLDWLDVKKSEEPDTQNLYQKYRNREFVIDATSQFFDNVLYSQKLQKEYGVSVTGESANFFSAEMKPVYEALRTLPPFAIKKTGFNSLRLMKLSQGVAAQMYGNEMLGEFKKGSTAYNRIDTYQHEISHAFEYNIEKGEDNEGWLEINKDAKPYVHDSGLEAIKAEIEAGVYSSNVEILGYANTFACNGGIREDKAVTSEYLFSQDRLEKLIKRVVDGDFILKQKIEFMSGYRIEDGRFGEKLSEKDYIDVKFKEVRYWPKWSKDKDGKVWMDADYFNAILDGKKVSFREENGKTIREISKK